MSINKTYQGKGFVQLTGSNSMQSNHTLSTITLGNVSSQTSQWLNNLSTSGAVTFDLSDHGRHHEVKKYEVYESPEDVLVLAATWKRMRDEGLKGRVSKLMDAALFREISPADRAMATEIRDYYSKKVMMWNLKGIHMTQYRKDLSKLIHSDGTILREDQMGIAYHLPAFYQYDQDFEEIRLCTNHSGLRGPITGRLELEPIKRLQRKTKTTNSIDYWFKDSKSQNPIRIGLNTRNPLQHIWDNMFENTEVLPVEGTFIHKNIDEFEYFLATDKWELKIA